MSEGNGKDIIRLGKRGVRTFQYDLGYPEKKLDVVLVSNQWRAIDSAFRNEKDEVPREREQEYAEAQHQFACALLEAPDMSMADAMHFMKLLTDEAEKLKPFFVPASAKEASSPTSSVTVGFSEMQ